MGVGEVKADTVDLCFEYGTEIVSAGPGRIKRVPRIWCVSTFVFNLDKATYNVGEPIVMSGSASSKVCSNQEVGIYAKYHIDNSSDVSIFSGSGTSGSGSAIYNGNLLPGIHNAVFSACNNLTGFCTQISIPFTVVAPPPPPPIVTLTATPTSVPIGGSSVLSWSSTNATQCTASGDWSGNDKSVAPGTHTENTATLNTEGTDAYSYTLTCTGPGGSRAETARVSVTAPHVTLDPPNSSIMAGESVDLIWSSKNTTLCTASASGPNPVTNWTSGIKSPNPTSNYVVNTPINTGALNTPGDQTYTITCEGASNGVVAAPTPATPIIFDYATASNGQTSANGQYTWTVPAGVTSVKVKAWGAGGAVANLGAGGGYTESIITVTPGENLSVFVGAGGVSRSIDHGADYGSCRVSIVGSGGQPSYLSRSTSIIQMAGGGGAGVTSGAGCVPNEWDTTSPVSVVGSPGGYDYYAALSQPYPSLPDIIKGSGGGSNSVLAPVCLGFGTPCHVLPAVVKTKSFWGGLNFSLLGGVKTNATGITPANSADANRGTAGNTETAGRIVLIPQNGTIPPPVTPTVSSTAVVTVNRVLPPEATLETSRLSVLLSDTYILSWKSKNSVSCVAGGTEGVWTADTRANGTDTEQAYNTVTKTAGSTGDKRYTLTCTGAGTTGSVTKEVTVNVYDPSISSCSTLSISNTIQCPYSQLGPGNRTSTLEPSCPVNPGCYYSCNTGYNLVAGSCVRISTPASIVTLMAHKKISQNLLYDVGNTTEIKIKKNQPFKLSWTQSDVSNAGICTRSTLGSFKAGNDTGIMNYWKNPLTIPASITKTINLDGSEGEIEGFKLENTGTYTFKISCQKAGYRASEKTVNVVVDPAGSFIEF